MRKLSPLDHYLAHYAEQEVAQLDLNELGLSGKRHRTWVIPAFDESPAFLSRVMTQPGIENTLAIIVLNQPDTIANPTQKNTAILRWLHDRAIDHQNHASVHTFRFEQSTLLVVDRFQNGNTIPVKQGVGLARKIGCDIGALAYQKGKLSSPWIYISDADAYWPKNYFAEQLASQSTSAKVFNFRHVHADSSPAVFAATQAYEAAIKYYAAGLAFAHSPYAFHTLGSALAVHADYYAAVRGVPKRAGAEDFYLLNKLAKLAPVHTDATITIDIAARISSRVPFGTGPAVSKLASLAPIEDIRQKFTYFSPECFYRLKALLAFMRSLSALPSEWTRDKWIHLAGDSLDDLEIGLLQSMGFDSLTQHLVKQCSNARQAEHHIMQWFDGFKTLRWIKCLTEQSYPEEPLARCLEKAECWRSQP